MTIEAAVTVEGLWKRFDRSGAGAPTLKQAVLSPFEHRRRRERFWALQDVNVSLRPGEALGVIGANGSGKSTLLRLIGGLGKPTRGRITRRRRVDAILTLGESFDPLLTGRENAITAGILAGYTRREIRARLQAVAAFSELEAFFDHPLRTYSDGMRVRLGFAVAMSTEPELLLIDEVLAVGDMRFQAKCYERLAELRAQGTTIVLASHDEDQVRRICDRAVWLSHGRMGASGSPDEAFAAYRRAMQAETERRAAAVPPEMGAAAAAPGSPSTRFGTYEVEIAAARVLREGERVGVEIRLEPRVAVEDPIVGVSLHRVADGVKVLDVSTAGDRLRVGRVDAPRTITLWLDRLDVEPGSYRFDVGVYERDWSYVYDYHWQAYPLELGGGSDGFGPPRRWSAEGGARP